MKTLILLSTLGLLSVCWSTGVVEPESVDDLDEAGPSAGPDSQSPLSSESDSTLDPPTSPSSSSSSSESEESDSADSSASDSNSSSSSSSSSSESSSSEITAAPPLAEAPQIIVKRDLASILLRSKRAAASLNLVQMESLREVCELHKGCDEMAETEGIVAAYSAYYGPVPF